MIVLRNGSSILNCIFVSAQVLLLLGLATRGHTEFMRSVASTTVLWVGYCWLENKHRVEIHNYVRTVTMLAIISDGFFGYYLGYYITSTIFDKIQHIFGIYAFSLFAFALLAKVLPAPLSGLGTYAVVISLGVSLGTYYEIAEFMVDTFGSPSIPAQANLLDTDLDLIADTIGAVMAAVHIRYAPFLAKR